MIQFDYSPLYRATVGFDQIADMFDRVLTSDTQTSSYPPYNIDLLLWLISNIKDKVWEGVGKTYPN